MPDLSAPIVILVANRSHATPLRMLPINKRCPIPFPPRAVYSDTNFPLRFPLVRRGGRCGQVVSAAETDVAPEDGESRARRRRGRGPFGKQK